MKKTIVINFLSIQPQNGTKNHGGGEYTKTILHRLLLNYLQDNEFYIIYDPNRYIDEWILKCIDEGSIRPIQISDYCQLKGNKIYENADVYYEGNLVDTSAILPPTKAYKIATFHGLRSLEMPVDKYQILYEKNMKGKVKTLIKLIFKKKGLFGHRRG